MFDYDGYTVVGSSSNRIYVDEHNVYVPQGLLDNPDLVETFEFLWNMSFYQKVKQLIIEFWTHTLFIKFGGTSISDEDKVIFHRLVTGDLPQDVINQFRVRKTDEYCYVSSSTKADFVYYGIYNAHDKMYVPYLEDTHKSTIMAALNNAIEIWSEGRFYQSLTFVQPDTRGWVISRGLVSINAEAETIVLNQLLETKLVTSFSLKAKPQQVPVFTLHVPQVDIISNRIKYNALSLEQNGVHSYAHQGAKITKGTWAVTKDKGNVVERPEEFYLDKLYTFCQDQSSDQLMSKALIVEHARDNVYLLANAFGGDSVKTFMAESVFLEVHADRVPRFLACLKQNKLYFGEAVTENDQRIVDAHMLALRLQV